MKNAMKTRATGWFTVGLLSASFGVSAAIAAPTLQIIPSVDTRMPAEGGTRSNTGQLRVAKNSTIARNSTVKQDAVKADAAATPSKEQDKKTMSRCWKRLMTVVRELNHAHRSKSK